MAKNTHNARYSFSSIKHPYKYPDFLEVQLRSFADFLKMNTTPEERKQEGLYQVFKENFPVQDTKENYLLEFIDYAITPPAYSIEECLRRGRTYEVGIRATFKLSSTDVDDEQSDFKASEQSVFLCNFPYMTPTGTFVINGAERVVVSQLHRSPGVFFSSQVSQTNKMTTYSARIIPFRGSWMEFSTDPTNMIYAYLDRKKKIAVTALLRAMGYSGDRDILVDLFGIAEEVKVNKTNLNKCIGRRLAAPVRYTYIQSRLEEATGELIESPRSQVVLESDAELTEENIAKILEYADKGIKTILLHKADDQTEENNSSYYSLIFNTLKKDPSDSEESAQKAIYRLLKGTDPSDESAAKDHFQNLFFSDKRYDLGEVGRFRINKRLSLDVDPNIRTLTKQDIIAIIKYLLNAHNSMAGVDDIDHLSNRRVRTVGEQLYNQFSAAMARFARGIKDGLNKLESSDVFRVQDIINNKAIGSITQKFFGSNPLSQFTDQINPLAEITHKRRLSALGPGGITRDRAGFEVRDVHYTHYGRLCPIETPEGPNIGLISSLSVYAKIDKLGFIETPYRKVQNGKVSFAEKDLNYYTAEDEEELMVAQGNAVIDDKGVFVKDKVKTRQGADFLVVPPKEVNLMDVSPSQIASIAASLIPFLEHDDANRALMGSNMMRQAVPLLRPQAPIVGTGIEHQVVLDSRMQIMAADAGVVTYVDATTIKVQYNRSEEDRLTSFDSDEVTYHLPKFRKTNQSTTIDLRPICKIGQKVEKDQVLTEGYATAGGELALGRNILVAYMPWKGYNYEDAVVLNERLVQEDIYTSVHVDEYSLEVRETKRGNEELTGDIPNVNEDATRNLDDRGIVRVGAHIKPGDILIGKITPKGESDPTPEEKLLRAIFGDKAGDVKDASLKATPSLYGVVVDTELYSRNIGKRTKAELQTIDNKINKEMEKAVNDLQKRLIEKLLVLTKGHKCQGVTDSMGVVFIKGGDGKFTKEALQSLSYENINLQGWTEDEHTNRLIERTIINYIAKIRECRTVAERKKNIDRNGDDLPTGVLQLAKVYIAQKRKIQVGDKMAGRHGNKGIVSKIVRREDMPFLEDGTPVDVCLNPLGVPSRMNIGQIFEAVLGWVGSRLGKKFATPIFDGASLDDIHELMDQVLAQEQASGRPSGVGHNGKTYLRDGGSGEYFDQPATVGVTYFLKLGHMVDDKMHARSIGPYSLITQQPLGGKANFGGQRFGEMEVWALEAFGAAHILQEMLTVKSDDVTGRAKTYEAIVKGEPMPTPGIPESLNVLLHELKGLGLKVTLDDK